MLDLADEKLDMLCELVPDFQPSPKGGRPPVSKRDALAGIFWVLDNGAKWKDLPKSFGSKSSVHRWFTRWVKDGVFEKILHAFGRFVEEQGASASMSSGTFRLHAHQRTSCASHWR